MAAARKKTARPAKKTPSWKPPTKTASPRHKTAAAAKKAKSAKKAAKKTPPAKKKARKVAVEVDEPDPVLITSDVEKAVVLAEQTIERLQSKSIGILGSDIQDQSRRAASFAASALASSALAIVHAWTCGCLLNQAKAMLPHGQFGKWRKENVLCETLGKRTSQRYMKLAECCTDVRALLEWNLTLRQSYIKDGVNRIGDLLDDGKANSSFRS